LHIYVAQHPIAPQEAAMSDKIEREIELPASVQTVWQTLTDPDCLSEWLADEVWLDLRPGGDALFVSGEEVKTGWVEEVSPPGEDGAGTGRLAFWWAVDDEPASRVSFSVTSRDEGSSLLRIVETRPLEVLDLVGVPLPGHGGRSYGPALVGVGA
jgi:uncharacterized protein YndB with AHSA1/START domain